jgi:polyhydroxyalkanoate synthesis regulator phasin
MTSNSREEYKLQALKERMGELVAQYEEKLADIRVDYTLAVNAYQEAKDRIEELQARVEHLENQDEARDADPDTVGDSSENDE